LLRVGHALRKIGVEYNQTVHFRTVASVTDVAILFALEEEFEEFFPYMKDVENEPHRTGTQFYVFEYKGSRREYTCVSTFVGTMGAQDAFDLTATVIDRYRPRTIVLIGIAGSLDKRVCVGDVVVADSVDDYLQDARVLPADGSFHFQLSGRTYRPNIIPINQLRHLKFSHTADYKLLMDQCRSDLNGLLDSLKPGERDAAAKIVRSGDVAITSGHLASGSVVGAANAFAGWLRSNRDRKYLAIEMESAGVMNAIYRRAGDEQALIIRGISDYSDERKDLLDQIGGGVFRGWATRNAIRVLLKLLDLGMIVSSDCPIFEIFRYEGQNSFEVMLENPGKGAGVIIGYELLVDDRTYVCSSSEDQQIATEQGSVAFQNVFRDLGLDGMLLPGTEYWLFLIRVCAEKS
jgi:nucleoside phosphorylase